MKFPKNFIWIVLVLIVALVAYAVGKQGQTVKTVNLGGKSGILIEFDKLENIPQDDLENRQDELEIKLREIEEGFQESPQVNKESQELNLSGTWQANLSSSSYIINQFGNAITIQEVNPFYGITAVGQGVIHQDIIKINYFNAFYIKGTGILRVLDSKRMEAQFALATGQRTSTVLYR